MDSLKIDTQVPYAMEFLRKAVELISKNPHLKVEEIEGVINISESTGPETLILPGNPVSWELLGPLLEEAELEYREQGGFSSQEIIQDIENL
ncbi:MAG: hypothetical protein H6581_23640 [Bacteroidia bacterium]|nr:hypothetical protein [Bacteroidia bacterium]